MLHALIVTANFLLASAALADDFPPGPGTTGTVKATGGVAVTGVFDFADDVDAFKVTLPKDGRAFGFTLTASCHRKVLKLYDAAFRLLKTSLPPPTSLMEQESFVEWRPTYAGTHYVQVTDLPRDPEIACREVPSDSYSVAGNVTCLDGRGTICTLPVNALKEGLFRSAGDTNWYRVTFNKHRSILVAVDTAGYRPLITLRSATGAFITDSFNGDDQGDYCGAGVSCMWAEVCPGTYYVDVTDYAMLAGPSPYKVSLGLRGAALPPC